MADSTKLPLEQRRERLQEALASQMVPGMRVEAQTDLSASIVFGGGLRRVFTVADDGTVLHQDYPPESSTAPTPAGPAKRSMGFVMKLVIAIVGLGAMGFCASYVSVVNEQRAAGVNEDNPWFTMRSRDDAIEITLRNGADTLRDARLVVNDRWTCEIGTVRKGAPVVVAKRTCLGEDGLPMPNLARALDVRLQSDPDGYLHTQSFRR